MAVNINKPQINLREQLKKLERPTTDRLAVKGADGVLIDKLTGELSLQSIDAMAGGTAVDVFVYDTSKDSDGGAWRKRTQHTSWYNETLNTSTRGSRKEFPAVAVIVREAGFLKIYDGDDPDLPMWMVFEANNNGATSYLLEYYTTGGTSVTALNGMITSGHNPNGATTINFISEKSIRYRTTSESGTYDILETIADRNTFASITFAPYANTIGLVNSVVNDVAMTVLLNAPIDPSTGLPIPTIAVATNGGVSVIKDDGTVVDFNDSLGSTRPISTVAIRGNDIVHWNINNGTLQQFFDALSATADSTNDVRYNYTVGGGNAASENVSALLRNSGDGPYHIVTRDSKSIAAGAQSGMSIFVDGTDRTFSTNNHSIFDSRVAYTTSNYNTGWMHGDIKGAFLSDTDATNVASSNLMSGATYNISARITSYSYTNGSDTLVINDDEATADGYVMLTLGGLSPSTKYVISYTSDNTYTPTTGYNPFMGNTSDGTSYFDTAQTGSGQGSMTFTTASSGDPTLVMYSNYSGGNLTFTIQLRLAEEDRSVNDNGLQVYGTVTKSAVAAGAELVAYTGFNGSNYLEQPHNSGMEVGTGDFYVMGWFKGLDNTYNAPFEISSPNNDVNGNGSILLLAGPAYPGLRFYTRNNSTGGWNSNSNGVPFVDDNSTWNFVCCLRRSGIKYIYMNGADGVNAGTHAEDLTETDSIMRLGCRSDTAPGSASPWTGSLSLWRFGQGAPSAEQIKKIYEDEKVLFQENASCTLYGSSDAVTALAFDDTTSLLHVGTSSGRSEFKGLRRVGNTTMAVTTAISASSGLVAEQ